MTNYFDEDDDDREPVGFLGRMRRRTWLVWLTIIGLVALTIGATTLVWLVQVSQLGR